jgi:glucokinase
MAMRDPDFVVLGIDIGGTHITGALVDINTRTIVGNSRKRQFVDARQSAENIISAWCDMINTAFADRPHLSKRICIAMPGPFDYDSGISLINKQEKFKSLYKLNVKSILASCFNISPGSIKFINDAACFLQGEVFCGAAQGYKEALGFTLGTGFGSAIYRDGFAEDGQMWNANFKNGISEDYLSTRWFVNRYMELSGKAISGVMELNETTDSNSYIQQVFDEFGENLALFLNNVALKKKFDLVVLGGNISNALSRFLPTLRNNLHSFIQIKKSMLGEDANLIGAASCWSFSLTDKENAA